MRVRSGRFKNSARTTKPVGSGSVTLSLYPKVFDADQALGFQPHVGQTLLQGWGSGHVPIAVATDAMLDRSFQTDAQGSQIQNLGTRQAPLFPVIFLQYVIYLKTEDKFRSKVRQNFIDVSFKRRGISAFCTIQMYFILCQSRSILLSSGL